MVARRDNKKYNKAMVFNKPQSYKTRQNYGKKRLRLININAVVNRIKSLFSRKNVLNVHQRLTTIKIVKKKSTLILLTYLASFVLATMVIFFFGIIIVFAYFSRELPSPNQLLERSFELSTRFYDRNGELIYEVYGDKNRTLVTMKEIPLDVIHATLAAEDSEFYQHQGYSVRGMARALRNTFTGEGLQGGSTLTQQVIKNTLLSQERTLIRKIKEMILSLQLENRYSKDEIIQMYLNESPYGGQNYGIYSAAKAYFNKNPNELTLSEAAYLAGLPQSPGRYSQFGLTPEAGIERKNYVLYLMHERGWVDSRGKKYFISDEEYEQARNEELKFQASKVPLEAPHFVFYAKQFLSDILGEEMVERGGLRIKTTLDLKIQKLAQDTVTSELEKVKSLNVWNGSMVVIDPKNGEILSMVGSKGYNLDPEPENCVSGGTGANSCKFDPYVNVALSNRQPGSAIKPVTYATLLSQGYTAALPFLDVPTSFEGSAPDKPYNPENYDGKFRGVMSLRKCLGNSINIPAVKALKIAGINNMIDQAEKMGISTFKERSRYGLALTLGGGETKLLELTGAYSVFAAKGIYRKPTPIIEVQDSAGNVVWKPGKVETRALDEKVAFIISDILSDDGARSEVFGTGSLLKISGFTVAAKTGTTDDKRDNYALGYTPSIVVGVWVGNSNNEKMDPYIASGITGASPIWHKFMLEYLKNAKDEKFEAPKDVEKMEIDTLTGGLPYEDMPKRNEWFIKSTEPTARSEWYEKLEVCKIDGRRTNQACKDADETEIESFIRITDTLPEWQSAVDAWIKEEYKGEKEYFPPQMVSQLEFDGGEVSNKENVGVEIVGLEDGSKVPYQFRLNIEISSYYDIDKVEIYFNGEKAAEDTNEPYGYNFKLSAKDFGEKVFKAIAVDEKGNEGDTEVKLNVGGF
jgi:penicillin-binding protein 1C